MKKQLLFLLLAFSFTVQSFAQANAYPPPNLMQCQNEIFDLTLHEQVILGNQTVPQFTVGYFETLADAQNSVNQIVDPMVYVALSQYQMIYARVTNTADDTFATTSFYIQWDVMPIAAGIEDITTCGFFLLPPPPPGTQWVMDEAGTVPAVNPITQTVTLYGYASNGVCVDIHPFTITIADTFVEDMPDVTACDFYILPALQIGNYYTASGASGTMLTAGTVLTSSQTIYVFTQIGPCTAETSFEVAILSTPIIEQPADVYSCGAYTFPALPIGHHYYTGPIATGQQLVAGHAITESQTIYIFAQNGICTDEASFTVTIGLEPIGVPASLEICNNGTGTGIFDLTIASASMLAEQPGLNITFFESEAEAIAGVNPLINAEAYASSNATIFVRFVGDDPDCFGIAPIALQVIICTDNILNGTVRIDMDGNGCSNDDPPAANVAVTLLNGNYLLWAYSNASGQYTFTNVPDGTNQVMIMDAPQGFEEPADQTIIFSGSGTQTADFCVDVMEPVHDLAITFVPTSQARPGFPATYALYIQNVGTTVLMPDISIAYDSTRLTFFTVTPATSVQSGNPIMISSMPIAPGQAMSYFFTFNVAVPPIAELGDVLVFDVQSTIDGTDVNPTNNSVFLNQTIVNSVDPNDIAVLEGPFITEEQADSYLTYVVRFQNIGDADAVNVRVENELSNYLDWSTFTPIGSNHTYFTERNGNMVTFNFNNVNLPGTTNEPNSHGHIVYKVKPVTALAPGEIIYASSNIFFDFNAPIATNTVSTQIQQMSVAENWTDSVALYPNPSDNEFYIQSISQIDAIFITDMTGKQVFRISASGNIPRIDVSGLESGIYFVNITSENQMITKKLIIR